MISGKVALLKFLTSFLELIGVGVVVPAARSFKKRITRVLDSIPVGVGVGVGVVWVWVGRVRRE